MCVWASVCVLLRTLFEKLIVSQRLIQVFPFTNVLYRISVKDAES